MKITSLEQCKTLVHYNLFFDHLMSRIKDKKVVARDIVPEEIQPLNAIFAKISHHPLETAEQLEYITHANQPYSQLEKMIVLNTYYNAILTFAIERYNSDTIPQVYFTVAEMMILNGMNKYRYLAFSFYNQMMGRVPQEYIRPNFSLIKAGMIQGVQETILEGFLPVLDRPRLDQVILFREIPLARLSQAKIDTTAQSVHGTHITAQVQQTLSQLFEDPRFSYPENTNERDLFQTYLQEYKNRLHKTKSSNLLDSFLNWFRRVKVQPIPKAISKTLLRIQNEETSFANYTTNKTYKLWQIFAKVYFIIKSLPNDLVEDGMIRLDEELSEANDMCAVGHLNRVINVLSGFDLFKTTDSSAYKDEIYTKMLKLVQEGIEKEEDASQKEMYETYIGDKKYIPKFKHFIKKHINQWTRDIHHQYTQLNPEDGRKMIFESLTRIGIYE